MNYIKYLMLVLLLIGCKKEDPSDSSGEIPSTFSAGLLILNEGLFQQNNSTLSWMNLATEEVNNDLFLKRNDRLLGDTGNDMKRYGGKVYIVVNASSTLEILDASTLKSIKQVPMQFNNIAQQPRYITFVGNKGFISSFDGYVNVLDTASLTITSRIKVGANPDGITSDENFVYVSNSGGLNFPNVDSTVTQINASNLTIQTSFHVGANPGSICVAPNGNVYVVKRGNYGNDPSELMYIDVNTGLVSNLEITASGLYTKDNQLYISYFDNSSQTSNIRVLNMNNQSILTEKLISGNEIETLYGLHVFEDESFICLDAMGYTNAGYLRFFSSTGVLKKSIQVGLNPNSILHYE